MAFVLVIIKAVLEVAALALFAQFLVGVFAWGRRKANPVYRLFEIVSGPMTRLTRLVTPKVVVDRHIPLATFLLIVFAWVIVLVELASSCRSDPAQQACAAVQRKA